MLLAANTGSEPRPLHKGASGGELSRVMLALEVALAGTSPVPTFVFDEVDAGVGGAAAVEVGRRLAQLARNAQVLVVTHLPQVAAYADRHVVVRKSSDGSDDQLGAHARSTRPPGSSSCRGCWRGWRGPTRRSRTPASCSRWPSRRAPCPETRVTAHPRATRRTPSPKRPRAVRQWRDMKLSTRRRPAPALPGLTATARVERRPRTLLTRLRPGDVAVVDHSDLDRATAQSLVDAGVVAVVNAAPMLSGRYPAQGPGLLASHGVLLLDRVGAAAGGVEDGSSVRLHDGVLHLDDGRALEGRLLEVAALEEETTRARLGLASQLETLTHNAAELLRREEELLLHGRGLPTLATTLRGTRRGRRGARAPSSWPSWRW